MKYQEVNQVLNEKLFTCQLDNGLNVFVHPKQGYHSKYAMFATKYGSNDNDFEALDGKRYKVPAGIAHFLEHKMFEEPSGNVFDDFSSLGVSVNAFTNYYMTAYLFSGTQNFYPALQRLIDFVQLPYFTDENVKKEQGIIEQEISMYDDHPGWMLQRNLLECMYHNHPIRIDIAGTVNSIHQIDKELLFTCYNTFYHPSNMILFIAGDVEVDQVFDKVEKYQQAKQFIPMKPIQRYYPEEPLSVNCTMRQEKMSIAVPLMALGYKDNLHGKSGVELLKREILTNLVYHLILGRSSKMFNELYEQGLISEEFSIGYTGSDNYAYTIMGGPTPNPQLLYDSLLAGFAASIKRGITGEAVERAKRKFSGLFTISYDNLSMIANRFTSYYLKGINFNDYPKLLAEISVDDVNQRLNECFNPDQHACSIILPKR